MFACKKALIGDRFRFSNKTYQIFSQKTPMSRWCFSHIHPFIIGCFTRYKIMILCRIDFRCHTTKFTCKHHGVIIALIAQVTWRSFRHNLNWMGNVVILSLSKSLQSCSYSDMNNQGKYHIRTSSLQSSGFTQTIPLIAIQWRQLWHITWRLLLGQLALSFRKTCIVALLIRSILRGKNAQAPQRGCSFPSQNRTNLQTNKTCIALRSIWIVEIAFG